MEEKADMNVNKCYTFQTYLSFTIMMSEMHLFSYGVWPVTEISLLNNQMMGFQSIEYALALKWNSQSAFLVLQEVFAQ